MALPGVDEEEPAGPPSRWWALAWLLSGLAGSGVLLRRAWTSSTGRDAVVFGAWGLGVAVLTGLLSWWRAGCCSSTPSSSDESDELRLLRERLAALELQQGDRPGPAVPAGGVAPGLAPAGLPPLPAPGGPAAPAGAWAPPPADGGPDGGMAALAAFARGQDVGGPISQMMGPGAAAAAAGGPPMPAVPQAGSGASSDGGAVAASARQVRSELDVLANALPPDPWWGQRFWRRIAELDAGGQLAPAVRAALQAKGYVGAATTGAPDVASLRVVLQGLEASAASGLSLGAMVPGGGHAASSSIDAWAHGLPPDFRRAAGEIYRNIRGAGVLSVRQWLTENHTGPKTSDAWQHLWAMATSIDFKIGGISSDQELYQLLNTDDNLELALRHLSAHVYEQRTKDYVGGARLRAVAAPGSQVDIAPGWLIGEATLRSKLEHQREERVQAELRRRQPKGDPKGGKPPKGGGRGGK